MTSTPPFAIKTLDHVVIRCRDIGRMIEFYRDVLGCPLEKAQEGIGLWQFRAGASLIDLVDVNGEIGKAGGPPPGNDGHNMDHFCVSVEGFDPDAINAWLANHGVEGGEPVQRYGAEGSGPSIYVTDPEGNTVELKGPPADPV